MNKNIKYNRGENQKHKTEKGEGDGERLKFKLRLLLARLNHLKFSSPSTYIFLTSFPIIHQWDLRNMYAWALPQGYTSFYFLSRWEISSFASRKRNLYCYKANSMFKVS